MGIFGLFYCHSSGIVILNELLGEEESLPVMRGLVW